MHKTIDQLLIIKVERDKLQEERDLLMEVNSKYDFHIEELKNKVRLLMGELHSKKEGQGKLVQQQIKTFNLVDNSTQTSGSVAALAVNSFSAATETTQDQRREDSGTERTGGIAEETSRADAPPLAPPPVPPPPPPIGPEDRALIPPPPPVPFGECVYIINHLHLTVSEKFTASCWSLQDKLEGVVGGWSLSLHQSLLLLHPVPTSLNYIDSIEG